MITNAKIINVSINFVIVPHQADFNSWILKRRVPYTKYLLTMVDSRYAHLSTCNHVIFIWCMTQRPGLWLYWPLCQAIMGFSWPPFCNRILGRKENEWPIHCKYYVLLYLLYKDLLSSFIHGRSRLKEFSK